MSESLLPANIFFITATIAIILLTTLSIIVFVYLIKILRDARHIFTTTKEQAEKIMNDLEEARKELQQKKTAFVNVADFLLRFFPKKK